MYRGFRVRRCLPEVSRADLVKAVSAPGVAAPLCPNFMRILRRRVRCCRVSDARTRTVLLAVPDHRAGIKKDRAAILFRMERVRERGRAVDFRPCKRLLSLVPLVSDT